MTIKAACNCRSQMMAVFSPLALNSLPAAFPFIPLEHGQGGVYHRAPCWHWIGQGARHSGGSPFVQSPLAIPPRSESSLVR